MIALVTTIHVIACIVLILVILLQAGKGGGVGAAFGGAGSQTVFGGRGAQTFLGKVTSVCAGIFIVTSVSLAYLSSRRGSVVTADDSGPVAPANDPRFPAPGQQSAPPADASVPPPAGATQESVQVPAPGTPTPAAPAGNPPAGSAAPASPPAGNAPPANPPAGQSR